MTARAHRSARAPGHDDDYDAVIVGGRVAGAATALLLARRGHRVLVLDRDRYGRDTLSTHALMRPAIVQLRRWGLLDRVVAAGTPPVRRVVFHYGDDPLPIDIAEPLYAPRRTVFDRILVDAAAAAGARFRFGVRVDDVLRDGGRVVGVRGRDRDGAAFTVRATVTVGADGRNSLLARRVGATVTRATTTRSAVLFGYWTGVEAAGYEWCFGSGTTGGLIPTNHDQVCVWAGMPTERFHALRGGREAAMHAILAETTPDVARRVAAGRRSGPIRGFPGQDGVMRRPWGPGWALVGDAGYFKDALTSHGMTDALRDAELLVRALDGVLSGREPEAPALSGYERRRDDLSIEFFDATARVATYDWDLRQVQADHLALSSAMQREARALTALDDVVLGSAAP
jgi:2-polyprenyl-6-methoxyphenol hydroxylase-like FAD-dependent oxidoreductase